MTRVFIVIALFALPFFNKPGYLGFSCGFAGTPTPSVVLIDSLVSNQDSESVRKQLTSKDYGTRCLAVIVLEVLQEKGQTTLTRKDKRRIRRAYKSSGKIKLCSGCTYQTETSLKNILNEIPVDDSGFNFKQLAHKRYSRLIEN